LLFIRPYKTLQVLGLGLQNQDFGVISPYNPFSFAVREQQAHIAVQSPGFIQSADAEAADQQFAAQWKGSSGGSRSGGHHKVGQRCGSEGHCQLQWICCTSGYWGHRAPGSIHCPAGQ